MEHFWAVKFALGYEKNTMYDLSYQETHFNFDFMTSYQAKSQSQNQKKKKVWKKLKSRTGPH